MGIRLGHSLTKEIFNHKTRVLTGCQSSCSGGVEDDLSTKTQQNTEPMGIEREYDGEIGEIQKWEI